MSGKDGERNVDDNKCKDCSPDCDVVVIVIEVAVVVVIVVVLVAI